jgi:ATP-binding cassette subfamily B protein
MSTSRLEESGTMSFTNMLRSFRYWPRVFYLLWGTNPASLIIILMLNVLRGAAPVLTLLLTQHLINSILVAWQSGFRVVLQAFAMMFVFTVCNELVSLLQNYVSKLFELRMANRINLMIMEKSTQLSLVDFENATVQDRLKRVQNEAGQRPYQIFQQILSLLSGMVTLVSAASVLVVWKWWMAFLLILIPISSFYSFLRLGEEEYQMQYKRTPKLRQTWYLSFLLTRDATFKEIKLFQLGQHLMKRYQQYYDEFFVEDRRMMRKRIRLGLVFQLINQLINGGMLLVVLYAAAMRQILIGNVVGFIQSITLTQSSSQSLVQGLLALCQHNLFLQELFAFLDMEAGRSKKVVHLSEQGQERLMSIETLEFRNVSFRYPGSERYALQQLSFTLHRGQTMAIVGRNGSGKTTLVKLITQLYDEYEGEILINGVPIHRYDQKDLHRRIGMVFQDFVQYEMSARQNIGFGDVSKLEQDELLEEAARQAGIEDLVKQWPKGFDTQLGSWFEEGHQLSGGQWQRLAIARAFMRDADLYLLDEPSSMLDPEAEQVVFEKFRDLIDNRLGIFISHRYSSSRLADHILMLDAGRLIEQGDHHQLMSQKGLYAQLYSLQASAYLDGEESEVQPAAM